MHSLIARVLDCARQNSACLISITQPNFTELSSRKNQLQTSSIGGLAAANLKKLLMKFLQNIRQRQQPTKHLRLEMRYLPTPYCLFVTAFFFWEFCDAIRDADVGRMWVVYDFWVFMMRGAGCHNYGNEILEMKAQFEHEFPPLLREVIEQTWLVNRWGKRGRSIPTDLYLEHNNGFTKVFFLVSFAQSI